MAYTNIALNASVSGAIAAGSNNDIFALAAGTYRGQSFQPKPGQQFWGDNAGRTILSGAWSITSWSSVSGQFAASQGSHDLNSNVALPAPLSQWLGTASISGTTLTISATTSGSMAAGFYVFGAGVAPGTFVNSGSGSTWTLNTSQTVASTTMWISGWSFLDNPGAPMNAALEDLYVDGTRYTRVMAPGPATAGTWWFDAVNKRIFVSTDLTGHNVEYACTPNIFGEYVLVNAGQAVGTVMKNITFEKFATSMLGVFWDEHGWTFDDCIFQHNHMTGLHLGGNCIVRGSKFTDNGLYGLVNGDNVGYTELLRNEIANNCWGGWDTGIDGGGYKLSGCPVHAQDNYVHDNIGTGMWHDTDSHGCHIHGNRVFRNTIGGIVYEISWGSTKIYDNIVGGNGGPGIYISNSDRCEVWDNIVVVNPGNSTFKGGIVAITAVRGNNSAGATRQVQTIYVHDNLCIHTSGDSAYDGILCFQAVASPNWVWTNNVYVNVTSNGSYWVFDVAGGTSGGTLKSWAQAQSAGYELGANSSIIVGGLPGSLSSMMNLLRDGQTAGAITPAAVRQALQVILTMLRYANYTSVS